MSRKVFLSFLGTSDYYPSRYYRGKTYCSAMEKYVQIAALQYVQRGCSWTERDVAYILLTELAEERNWRDGNYTDRFGKQNVGLESVLKKQNFPFRCEAIRNIPEGKTEKEIWQIFKTIHDLIQEGDELYFDITHGYRYLPMLVVVLGNYSKFLEKVKVMRILYGNYEGRDKDAEGNFVDPARSPLIDLRSFSTLQDWTYAVADFINNGNAERMSTLTEDASMPLIQHGNERAALLKRLIGSILDFSKDMQTCRGLNILDGTTVQELKQNLQELEDVFAHEKEKVTADELLLPVFRQIKDKVAHYRGSRDVRNGFQAVGWCLDHGLYQQAITILQESVKNYFLLHLEMEIKSYENRELINDLLKMAKYRHAEELPLEVGLPMGATEWSKQMKWIAYDYDRLSKLRNDFNHSGINDMPAEYAKIEETIKRKYLSISQKLGISIDIN